jgi:arylsulfatase A-like enzyme
MHQGLAGWIILGLAGTVVTAQNVSAGAPRRPNIVIILADDMGFSDIGCYGSEIATPNLDRLAAGGLRFTQFYNGARCCPTRAALLTGLYAHQAGVGHMVEDRGLPGYRGFLNDRCVTIAEVLGQAGYRTLMVGKWHVGERRPHWPVDRGFERYFGLVSGGSNYWRLDPGRIMARDDQPYTPQGDGFYMTDAFADQAAQFIAEQRGSEKPFFLYLAFTAPHWPLHAWPQDIAKYETRYKAGWDALRAERHRRLIDMGIVDPRWPLTPRDPVAPAWEDVKDKAAECRKMAVYAAQIDRLDQGIGKILGKLREIGAEQNTLVMFLSDNGGCAEQIDRGTPGVPPGPKESFLSYGLPWANASNTPFRRYKHWVHEGGIATPLIAYWPGVIRKGGELTPQVGHIIDLMATCVDVAGAAYPQTCKDRPIPPMEGKSLLPVFEGRTRRPHDALFWEHEGNRAVRQGKWKLVSVNRADWELYDLEADRTELNNLAAAHPDRVRGMAEIYERWAERCNVKVPPSASRPRRPAKPTSGPK